MKAINIKKLVILAAISFIMLKGFSQSPQGFSYQAVIRNGSGEPLASHLVGLKITLQNTSQVVYYSETHTPTSNAQGVINVTIGSGTIVGVNPFTSIPWVNGDVFMKVEIDTEGGTSYIAMGSPTKLQSVPYALYSLSGQQGPAGTDGISIQWLGSFPSTSIPTGFLNNAYYNSTDKKSYIHNGADWQMMTQDGAIGPQGPKGDAGTGLINKGTWSNAASYVSGDYVFDRSTNDPLVNSMWICQLDRSATTTNPYQDLTYWSEFQAPSGPEGPIGPVGIAGPSGTNGVSISWRGTYASDPASPLLNYAYYNSTDKKSYVYNGSSWQMMTQDGIPTSGSIGQTLYHNGTSWVASSELINNGTNVGIGTSTPSQKLDVNGNLRLQGQLYDNINNPGGSGQLLTNNGTGVEWKTLSNASIPSGTGTSGQVAIWNGTNTLQGVSNVTWGTSLQIASVTPALPDDPIFEVKNKDGLVVFGVYQGGVRIYVEDSPIVKGAKGGFAVGGLTNQSKGEPAEYMRITSDSARIYVKESTAKGAKGGFAVGGLTNQSKSVVSRDFLFIASDSARIYIDESTTKGAKGGFAVGGLINQSKGSQYDLLKITTDSTRFYVKDNITKGAKGGFAVGGLINQSKGTTPERFMFIDRDSTRIYVNNGTTKGAKGGFAVGGLINQSKGGGSNNFMEGMPDSTRIYVSNETLINSLGGFAIKSKENIKNDYFNISSATTAGIVNNESRVMWYPTKSALLAGEISVAHPDSVGQFSVSLGYHNIAKGNYSQAMGYNSVARGNYSTAMGFEAVASENSFSFGSGSKALGFNSFAFGGKGVNALGTILDTYTTAKGDFSFAFGLGSIARELGSFVLGVNCESSGKFAIATGFGSKATGANATAMGLNAEASGIESFASGSNAKAIGLNSTAMGLNTEASGIGSFATGNYSKAIGLNSTSMGVNNVSSGEGSFTLGSGNIASAQTAFAIGANNTASGIASLALGANNTASGLRSIVGGYQNTASGAASFAIGTLNSVIGNMSIAAGTNNSCSGVTSAAFGSDNLSSGSRSFATGDHSKATGTNSFAMGYYSQAKADNSLAIGYQDTTTGLSSFATGYRTGARGDYSIAAGFQTVAQPFLSFVIGRNNTVSGSTTAWTSTEPLFIAGNGSTSASKNDALVLYKNGNMKLDGSFYPNDDALPSLGLSTNRWAVVYAVNGTIQTSDSRLKKDIHNLNYGLNDLLLLHPVAFKWKDGSDQNIKLGLVAQEVQSIIKEVVDVGNDENKTLGINYTSLVPILIKSIQEQQQIIEEQKSKNLKLEGQLIEIGKRLEELEKKIK